MQSDRNRPLNRWLRLTGLAIVLGGLIVCTSYSFIKANPQQSFASGIAAHQEGDMVGVAVAIEELKPFPAYEAHRQLLEGLMQMSNQRWPEALDALAKAVSSEDTTGLALLHMGQIQYHLKDYRAAEQSLLAALEADQTLVDAERYLVAIYYDIGAMDNVLKHAQRISELASDDSRPWRIQGLVLKDFEKYDQAVPAYLGALARKPNDELANEIHYELAECFYMLREPQKSLDQLDRATPTADALALAGECQLSLGRWELGQSLLEKSLQADSANLRALSAKATMLLEQGDAEAARQTLLIAAAKHPYQFNIRVKLAQVCQRLGLKAEADLQQAKATELRELRDRFTELHIKSIKETSDAQLRLELARTALQLGMPDAAASWYQAALTLNPNMPQAQQELKQLLSELPTDRAPSKPAPSIR